jgi:hypothetical protein
VVPPFAVNDKFADALRIQTTAGSVTVTSNLAGKEPGEPEHAHKAGGASVWWRWTAPSAGTVTFDTTGSEFDTLLAAYTGNAVDSLTEVASNDDEIGSQSRVDFTADAGTTYYVAVDGVGAATGNVALNWRFSGPTVPAPDVAVTPSTPIVIEGSAGGPFEPAQITYTISNVSPVVQGFEILGIPEWLTASTHRCCIEPDGEVVVSFDVNEAAGVMAPGTYHTHLEFDEVEREVTLRVTQSAPPNDAFASAEALTGEAAVVDANNVGATAEVGEPGHAGHVARTSLWWRFTPATDTHVVINSRGSAIDTLLGVYTGASVDALTEIVSSDDVPGNSASEVAFAAIGGITYHVVVDGHNGETGAMRLSLQADVLRVPADFPDIQSAVDAAHEGETIRIALGTYTEPVVLNKELELSGGWDDDFVTQIGLSEIDGEAIRPGVVMEAGGTLERLRVLHGVPGIWIFGGQGTVIRESEISESFEIGIVAEASAVIVEIERSTVSNNTGEDAQGFCSSARPGGGITSGAMLRVINSTVSGNFGCDGSGGGGGIRGNEVEIIHSTVTDNEVRPGRPPQTGGVNATTLTLRNSIVTGNRGQNTALQCFKPVLKDEGNNVGFGCGDYGAELRLCPLGDYGGPTRTHALREGSGALDAAPLATCVGANLNALLVDQRGEPRPVGAACEIGAFEGTVPFDFPTEARDWQPLDEERFWTYELSTGESVSTRVVPGTVKLGGVQTTRVRDETRGTTDYYASGCTGLRLYRTDKPFPGLISRFVFDRPMEILSATPQEGDVLESRGDVRTTFSGIGTVGLSYQSSAAVQGIESVSVPAGTFDALRLSLTVRVYRSEFGIDETMAYTIWFARGIGEIRRRVDAFGDLVTAELVGRTPEILDPAPGSTIPAHETVFSWSLNGTPVDRVRLLLGKTPGRSDFYDSGNLLPGISSRSVSGLSMTGVPVHARLRFMVDGTWYSRDFAYTTAPLPEPRLTGPALHGLDAADAMFRWIDNGHDVEKWRLRIGKRRGTSHYFDSGVLDAKVRSQPVSALPAYGETIHARLQWQLRGKWHSQDYPIDTAHFPEPALTEPAGATLNTAAGVVFRWTNNGHAVEHWRLRIGRSPGRSDFFNSGNLGGATLEQLVPALPTQGEPLYVRLQWRILGTWSAGDQVRTAVHYPPPLVQSPAPGSVLSAGDMNLSLDPRGHDVTEVRAYGGTLPGTRDLFRTRRLRVVTGTDPVVIPLSMPAGTAGPVYVRVTYRIGRGSWQGVDTMYNRPEGVVPVYAGSGDWNSYVRNDGVNAYWASGRGCRGSERGANVCLHGGEFLQFILPSGVTKCEGIDATDALGAFEWTCREDLAPPRMVSTGLADGMRLTDLLDTSVPGWRENHLIVTGIPGGPDPLVTADEVWWGNAVEAAPGNGRLTTSGIIYVVQDAAALTDAVSIERVPGVALVVADGQTLTSPFIPGDAVLSMSRSPFSWVEGAIDASGASHGLHLDRVKFSRLNAVLVTGADEPVPRRRGLTTPPAGIVLASSHYNLLTGVSVDATQAGGDGLVLERANGNVLEDLEAIGNAGDGLVLKRAAGNRIWALRTAANGRHGAYLTRATANLLHEVTAYNNGDAGSGEGAGIAVESSASQRNELVSVYAFANAGDGITVNRGRRGLIRWLTSANNGGNGLSLLGAWDVTVDSAVTTNNALHGISLDGRAQRNVLKDFVSAHNGEAAVGVGLSVAGRSTRNAVLGHIAFGANAGGNCVVEARSGDIVDGTCQNSRGAQPEAVDFDADLAAAFVGKLTSGGPGGNGADAFDLLTGEDWTDLGLNWDERARRGWGRDGGAFPASDHRGPCVSGETCRLWDFGLSDGAAPDLQDRFGLPTATDVLTAKLRATERVLDHAIELLDGVAGDGDLRCDSGELCAHTPNIGAFQGVDITGDAVANTGLRTNPRDRTPHVEDGDLYSPEFTGVIVPP